MGSVWSYAFQKWRDRRERVRARHFDVYVEMIEAMCGMGVALLRGGGFDNALSRYFEAKARFAIVGSDVAMRALLSFDRPIASGQKVENSDFDVAFGRLLHALRHENLGATSIQPEDFVILTPYGKSIRRT
jgi:hypothetical protein